MSYNILKFTQSNKFLQLILKNIRMSSTFYEKKDMKYTVGIVCNIIYVIYIKIKDFVNCKNILGREHIKREMSDTNWAWSL